MFIVKNITTLDVDIPDLRITLAPNQKIDLDMVTSRFYIDQSGVLKNLLRTQKLQCIIKDSGISPVKKHEQPQAPQASQVDVLNAVKSLEAKIEKRISEKVATQQTNVDVVALNQALTALQKLVGDGKVANQTSNTQNEDTKIDDAKLVELQKKTVNRLVNKTEIKVNHDVQTGSSNVKENIKELEDLL